MWCVLCCQHLSRVHITVCCHFIITVYLKPLQISIDLCQQFGCVRRWTMKFLAKPCVSKMQLTPTQEVPETLDVFQFSGFQHEVNIFAFWCSVVFYCTFTSSGFHPQESMNNQVKSCSTNMYSFINFKSPNQKIIYRNIESGMIVQKRMISTTSHKDF